MPALNPRRMLIDATQPEETRVAIVDQNLKLEHLDIVHKGREPLKGNIYLAKVRRIEPSLQAAFVEYDQDGVKRHGFLSFAEIHPDYFRIPTSDREALRAALSRVEEKAAEAVARGETVALDAIEAAPGGLGFAQDEEQPEDSYDGVPDAPLAPSLSSRDPLQPIDLYGDEGDAPHSYEGFGGALQQDGFHDSFAASYQDVPRPANDAPEGQVENDFPAGDGMAGEELTDARPAPRDYETVGGGASEDELEEQRRRVRQKFLRNYRIQEVVKRGQVLLIQVVKEERGNKGAALTTYLSLAGRYCVLMPNSDRSGGVSRKISNPGDRRRLKETLDGLDMPEGVSVILRTAGVERSAEEIRRDYDYLSRVWDQIRESTLKSTAPALIYEEANLIKRAIRDHVTREVDGIVVEGEAAYQLAKDFIRILMPSHEDRVVEYQRTKQGAIPLFARYQVEPQIDKLYEPVVQLKSGGYLVINPTEALVSIDVNSGRATRDRHIEETALRTNMEAAEEVARQLRLRDLAGLVVIDFIDMEEGRHNSQVERKLKEAMRPDRARLQIGRISGFGLLELSRQRLRPSLLETNFEGCPHCAGTGHVRSADSAALSVLRAIEEEGLRGRASQLAVDVPTPVALYMLNEKREQLSAISARYDLKVYVRSDEAMQHHEFKLERLEARGDYKETGRDEGRARVPDGRRVFANSAAELGLPPLADLPEEKQPRRERSEAVDEDEEEDVRGERPERAERGERTERSGDKKGRSRRTRGGRGRDESRGESVRPVELADNDNEAGQAADGDDTAGTPGEGTGDSNGEKRSRRGRRGGRRRGPLGMRRERGERTGAEGEAQPEGGEPSGEPAFADATVLEIDTTPRPVDRTVDRGAGRSGQQNNQSRQGGSQGSGQGGRGGSRALHGTAHVPAADGSQTNLPVHGVEGLGDKPEGSPQPAKTGWWRRWTGA